VEVEYIPTALDRERLLNARFLDIRSLLHADVNADISDRAKLYKEEIELVFGVTFENESGADEWGVGPRGFVALHFVRLGLEATAAAFKRWAEEEIQRQELNLAVDQYALFQKVANQITFRNCAAEKDNFATAEGNVIKVWRRPGEMRQAIMTPNNCIHELGHFFSRSAGNNTAKLGSIETALDPGFFPDSPAVGFTREGMGPDYLRDRIDPGDFDTLFLDYAEPVDRNSDGVVEFERIDDLPAEIPQLPATDFLMYDILGDSYQLWSSGYNIYKLPPAGGFARIDLFVQNYPVSTDLDALNPEMAADAFLNWVRGSFFGAKGAEWQQFFDEFYQVASQTVSQRMGMFLRNAVIYRNGMSGYFKPIIFEPSQPRSFIGSAFNRVAPIVNEWTNVRIEATSTVLYGWAENENETWFLIGDPTDPLRLLWRTIDAIEYLPDDLASDRKIIAPLRLSPGRPYTDDDLRVILGY
jgi:hypothetical protein